MCIVRSYLAEFLENLCLILRRDPDSGVTDRNLHNTIDLPGVNSDPSALRSKLHGVGKKIEKNLFDLPLIAGEVAKSLVNRNIEINAVFCSPLPHKRARIVYGQGEIKRSNL